MSEPGGNQTHTPFYMCMMAEDQDEALADVMALAKANREVDLDSAREALAEIHEIVKSYLDA